MKKININKDVESRRNIASRKPAVQPIVKPTRPTKSDKADETKKEEKEDTEVKATPESTNGATKRVTKKV